MAYIGNTTVIPCNRGGLTHSPNVDMVEPHMMIHPTRNLNLDEQGRRKRGGTAHVNALALAPYQIMGLFDFTMVGGTQYIIVALKNGSVYKNATETIHDTALSVANYFDFEIFENVLYIADGASTSRKWTGTGNASAITPASDWTSNSEGPQWLVKHGRGASERLWAGGCPSTPETIYISPDGTGDDFSANLTLPIETGDGLGIIGAVEFGDRLLCFGKRKTYIITDESSDTDDWGYSSSQWEGGAANFRLIIKTPTDIVAMMEDGEIYSVMAAQTYGDYQAASLTKDSFMHGWIKERIKLSAFNDFHMRYDPTLRAIKVFVVRTGKTKVDTALVYFIDRSPNEAWMIHDNPDGSGSLSGYSASASALIRASAGSYKIYTGDYAGNVWKLEETNRNDQGADYHGGFKLPWLNCGNPRINKNFKRGWITTEMKGNWNLNVRWWIDGDEKTARTIPLAEVGSTLDDNTTSPDSIYKIADKTTTVASTDFKLAGVELKDKSFELGDIGNRLGLEIYTPGADEDFYISQLLIDWKPLGGKPSK